MQTELCIQNAILYINHILTLEEQVGHKANYTQFAPSIFSHDLNKAAKQIGEYAGIKSKFIVTTGKTKSNVAGNIEHDGEFDFITISSDKKTHNSNLAILAHEISHRFLYDNNIKSPIEIDNEVLTDITAVWLGFGKLMLDGIYSETQETTKEIGREITTTYTSYIGYMDYSSFCFVYLLINKLRNIPEKSYLSDLDQSIINDLIYIGFNDVFEYTISCMQKQDNNNKLSSCKRYIYELKEHFNKYNSFYEKATGSYGNGSSNTYNPVYNSVKMLYRNIVLDKYIDDMNNEKIRFVEYLNSNKTKTQNNNTESKKKSTCSDVKNNSNLNTVKCFNPKIGFIIEFA